MKDLTQLARGVLHDAHLATLCTRDAQGVWAAPVMFIGDDDLTVYWLSQPHARHSEAIASGEEIAVAITAAWMAGSERALQMTGRAEVCDEIPKEIFDAYAQKRGLDAFEQKLRTEERGTKWYRFTADRIELIHNERFGYDRQRLR